MDSTQSSLKHRLADVWNPLFQNGYNFTPIKPRHKRPIFDGWQGVEVDADSAVKWSKLYPDHGVGILTAHMPAIDIDVRDEGLASDIQSLIELDYGDTIVRFGNAPKRLMLFRTDSSFSKVQSAVWISPDGKDHRVEILGDGQQFVSYGIHPDTENPYWWLDSKGPHNTPQHDLPHLSEDDALNICDAFDALAQNAGWRRSKVNTGTRGARFTEWDDDDIFQDSDSVRKWEGPEDELERLVMLYPNPEDYDEWVKVMMALQVSVEDEDMAYRIALKWSAQALNFDQSDFDHKWENGFKHRGRVVSLGTILKVVYEVEREQEQIAAEKLIPLFKEAMDTQDWAAAASTLRSEAVFGIARSDVTAAAIEAFKRIKGRTPDKSEIKSLLSYRPNVRDIPEWLKPWVFDQVAGKFVNRNNGVAVRADAFNLANVGYVNAVELGNATPLELATKTFRVPVVDGIRFDPVMHGDLENSEWSKEWGSGSTDIFRDPEGRVFLNTFVPETLAPIPSKLTKAERKAVDVVKDFFAVQFPNPTDREYVLEWLAWIVNNPGRRMTYALLIRGCQGSGKTIIGEMLRTMLGSPNVNVVNNKVFQGKFTSWAVGGLVKVLEEVSVPRNKYDVLNDLKDKITNEFILCERKGVDAYEVKNTASVLMLTNDSAALPISDEDRRYLVVESYFTHKRMVSEFLETEPDFFRNVDTAFRRYPGAIRKWFSDWEFRAGFSHSGGHAPDNTDARRHMVDAAVDDCTAIIEHAIAEKSEYGICPGLIFLPCLRDLILNSDVEVDIPNNRYIGVKLRAMGFKKIGLRHSQIRIDDLKGYVYALSPRDWMKENGHADAERIREAFVAQNPNGRDDAFADPEEL